MRILKGRSPGNKIRFRPGFGLAVARTQIDNDPTDWDNAKLRLKSCKKISIVQLRVSWPALEDANTPGLYNGGDWPKIDQ